MKQHELLHHVADNIEAGRPAGYGLQYAGGNKISCHIDFYNPASYQLKPKTVTINGIEVERGVYFDLAEDQGYFIPVIDREDFCLEYHWCNDDLDKQWLDRGLVFLEKEKAMAMAKAMLAFDES